MCTQAEKMKELGYKPETPYEKMNRKREEAKNNVLAGRKENVEVDDVNINKKKDV